jgi:hypothetical protein
MRDHYLLAVLFGSIVTGIYLERWRARRSRRKWSAKRGIVQGGPRNNPFRIQKLGIAPSTDPAEQLRVVMGATFEKRRLLSWNESRVLYTAENAMKQAGLGWRVMAQVSLGEVLSSPDARAYSAINSKRADILIVCSRGFPIAAIEYQGGGHYQGSAAARDAVKREALRKAGVRYLEVTPEDDPEELARELLRIAKV